MTRSEDEAFERLRKLHGAIADDEARIADVVARNGLQVDLAPSMPAVQEAKTLDDLLAAHGLLGVPLVRFDLTPVRHALRSIELEELPQLDESVFAKWRPLDLPMMFLAGAVGAGLSWFLRETFAGWHDDQWQKLPWNKGGHGGEVIDRVPGSEFGGGFGHRWRFGHDLANPFEVNWDDYLTELPEGGALPAITQKLFYWFRHLLQDTFSREGLGLPGHSLFRDWLEPLVRTKAGRETLQALGTLKARDLAGAGATNAIMGAYLWGTEGDLSRVVAKANYRCFSLMAGANLVTILAGLLVPPPATSLNWPSMPPLLYYGGRLIWLWRGIEKTLRARAEVLSERDATLEMVQADLARGDGDLGDRDRQLVLSAQYLVSLRGQAQSMRAAMGGAGQRAWSDQIDAWEAAESDEAQLSIVTRACSALFEGRE